MKTDTKLSVLTLLGTARMVAYAASTLGKLQLLEEMVTNAEEEASLAIRNAMRR